MRLLDFVVDKQSICKSTNCDFTGLVAGTKGYLYARFGFSAEWRSIKKVAVFKCDSGEYPVIIKHGMCRVPDEVAAATSFKVTVIGRNNNKTMTCSHATVVQRRC